MGETTVSGGIPSDREGWVIHRTVPIASGQPEPPLGTPPIAVHVAGTVAVDGDQGMWHA